MRSASKRIKTWAEIEAWRRWFAWHPVRIEGPEGYYRIVWLEWIERRTRWSKAGGDLTGPLPTEYREVQP